MRGPGMWNWCPFVSYVGPVRDKGFMWSVNKVCTTRQ